jgi:hypothetical protein
MIAQWFWFILAIVVLVWYSTITVYVAIRGGFDVKHMLQRLDETRRDVSRFEVIPGKSPEKD